MDRRAHVLEKRKRLVACDTSFDIPAVKGVVSSGLLMINMQKLISSVRREAERAVNTYRRTAGTVKNGRLWAIRMILAPYVTIRCHVTSRNGGRFYLDDDPVDDLILEGLFGRHASLYFPEEISGLRDDFLVLDVGAHHGFYAVETLTRWPRASLIAVEPNPTAARLLGKNLSANNLMERAEVVRAAVSSRDGDVFLKFDEGRSWGASIFAGERGDGVRVPAATISTLLKGRKPNLMKCNAEGAEFDLFPQLFEIGVRPEIVILMAHPEFGSVEELLKLFRKEEYSIRDAGSTENRIRLHCLLH